MSKVQRRFLRREGRRLWATTNVQGKKGMMKLLPVKEKQIHEVLVTLYMDKGELNSEQWKRAGLGTAGHDQFLFISCRQTQYRPKSKNIWVFPNSYILTLGKHKRNVVIGKMWTKKLWKTVRVLQEVVRWPGCTWSMEKHSSTSKLASVHWCTECLEFQKFYSRNKTSNINQTIEISFCKQQKVCKMGKRS